MIENLNQLKEAIKKINSNWANTDGSDQAVIDEALGLINSFEAVVRKRAELLVASANRHTGTGDIENTEIAVRLDYQAKELRSILKGEGGEKKKG